MEVNRKTSGLLDVVGSLRSKAVTDETAAQMLLECGYSTDIESARRTVILIHNDISNSELAKASS